MERDDRAPVATFLTDAALAPDATVALGEAAAHHARVKRLDVGDRVRLSDGAGTLAAGAISALSRGEVLVRIAATERVPAPAPIHLRAPVADRDRMLWLAEKATELGIASWQAVRYRRSLSVSPRGEGPAFADKVRARMRAALEQSGGAWVPEMLPDMSLDTLRLRDEQIGIVLDVAGEPLADVLYRANHLQPVVLVGPEGGIEADEREALLEFGWVPARLAATTLRFETAAIAAIAAIAVLRASTL